MRTLTRRAAALVLVSTLSLAGCGSSDGDGGSDGGSGSDDTATSKTDVAPAAGDTISAEAFEFSVPDGWKDSKSAMPTALAVAADSTDDDGFSDNVNVLGDNTIAGLDTAEVEEAAEKVLKDFKATDIKVKDPIEVAGEESAHIGAIFEQNGIKYRTEQYALSHDDKGYVITFSYSETLPEADRDKVSESILASWKWTS